MGYKVKMQHNLEVEEIYKFGTQGNEPVAEDVSQCKVTFEEASHATQLNSGSTLSTLFGLVKKWLNDLVDRINGKQDTLTAGENITIENNVISSTGGSGGGGGGTPVEYIDKTTYEELEAEGTYEPDTLYLVMYNDSDTIYATFYNGSLYTLAQGSGTNVTDIDEDDWLTLVENPDDPVWDNCQTGYYFIWYGDNTKVLRRIAAVHYDEGNQGSYIYTNDYNNTIHLMQQSEYDEVITGGEVPGGFSYCKDTRNFYYEDQVIVQNTPPAT